MSALPESSEVHPDRTAAGDEFARRLPGLGDGALRLTLQVLQARLGTAGEQPGDLERARLLAHEISNRATAANLASDLRRLDATLDALPS